jgi:F-type H+-transporting ATPase subunit epsilon
VKISIVTPERLVYEGDASGMYAPGWNGEFGALEGHVGYLAALRGGVVKVLADGGEKRFAVGRGFAEVGGGRVTVLVDACVTAEKVDKNAATADLNGAAAELAAAGGSEAAIDRADERREFASARLAL